MISISVILPSYKPGNYLYCCIDSILNQSLMQTDYEVILILNGCKEPYQSAIESYLSEKDTNKIVKLLQIDTPGVSNARNLGIEESKGEYITFVDDDDFISSTYLEALKRVADKETIGLSNEMLFNPDDNTTRLEYFSEEYKKRAGLGKLPYYKVRKYFSPPYMKLIHRDIIGEYRFDTRYTNGEDSLFMFQISRNMKYVDFTTPDAIYYRRARKDSAMSKERDCFIMIKNRLSMAGSFIKIYLKSPTKYNFWFLMTRIMGCLHSIYNSIKLLFRSV